MLYISDMELLIIIIASLLMLIGFIGAIIPIIPGPIISYLGLLLIYFFTELSFSMNEILFYTILTIIIFFSDYLLQFIGVKKFGGKKYSIYGTMLGILIGLLFVPIGLIAGPFLGAYLGALMDNKQENQAIRIAFGSLIGFVFGTFIKIAYSLYLMYIDQNIILKYYFN